LADRGLEKASVMTLEGVAAGRVLYPKFGGKSTQVDAVPLKAS